MTVRDGDFAVFGGRLLTGLVEITSDLSVLDGRGMWAVVLPFDGSALCARFESLASAPPWPDAERRCSVGPWTTSLSRDDFVKGVESIRQEIAAGDVYQVNLCRRLSAAVPLDFDPRVLAAALARQNPAPYAAVVNLPSAGLRVISASPERFLRRRGDLVESEPIKGTACSEADLSAKDRAENVMIVDLVRNDLGRVCSFGTVHVGDLCRVERHPGLVHLVSTVSGRLRPGVGWPELLAATFPPGSVTGAPKLAALDTIARLEPVDRGVYCGAVGWVDADGGQGDLSVAIRTFWVAGGRIHLGTGAGITWDSVAQAEWAETELKIHRLRSAAA